MSNSLRSYISDKKQELENKNYIIMVDQNIFHISTGLSRLFDPGLENASAASLFSRDELSGVKNDVKEVVNGISKVKMRGGAFEYIVDLYTQREKVCGRVVSAMIVSDMKILTKAA